MQYPPQMPTSIAATLEHLALELKADPFHLAAAIDFETAGTWSPEICNVAMPEQPEGGKARQYARQYSRLTELERKYIVAMGLIQLTRVGLNEIHRRTGKRFTFDMLANLSQVAQLTGPVRTYLMPFAGRLNDPTDCYMAIFCPVAVGKPLEYVLPYQGRSYELNKALDRNEDGSITKLEAGRPIVRRLEEWSR